MLARYAHGYVPSAPNPFAMNRLLSVLMFFVSVLSWAQTTSDCDGAIVLCGDVYSETESSASNGDVVEFTGVCNQSVEEFSIWYTFTVYEAGMLSFVLNPLVAADDYDWGLFDITEGGCAGIGATMGAVSPEVGCNSYGEFGSNGPTGISTANGGTGNSNGPGNTNGPPFNADLPVAEGSSYALVVMNWSQSDDGYTIDFGQSTAVLYDQEPPQLESLETDCVLQDFVVTFSEPLVTATVEPVDFLLYDPSGTAMPVQSATPNTGGNTSDSFTLSLVEPLSVSGTYTLEITENSLLVEDPCGNAGEGTLEQYFEVVQPPVGWDEFELVICTGEDLRLDPNLVVEQPEDNLVEYVWTLDMGDGNDPDTLGMDDHLSVEQPGLYHVSMTTNPPCYEAEGSFLVEEETCSVLIPNVISPFSSLGVNDRFYIPGLQVFPDASIRIFNRWGNLVYENDRFDVSSGWDPREDGASSGVYYYVLTLPKLPVPLILSDGNGNDTPYTGDAPAVFEGTLHVVD